MEKVEKDLKNKGKSVNTTPPLPTQPSSSTAIPTPTPITVAPTVPASRWVDKVKQNRDWPDKLRVSHSGSRFELKPVVGSDRVVTDGILRLPDSIVDEARPFWDTCLVGWFCGSRMPIFAVRSIAMRVWKEFGLLEVTQWGKDGFVFRFGNIESLNSVLEKGTWTFGSRTIYLQRWTPEVERVELSSVPVWVRLHDVPLSAWSPSGLSMIASMIGRPIACDQMTHERKRLSYARVLISLDAAVAPPREVRVQTNFLKYIQDIRVEYEAKPSRCPHCCTWGHTCTDSDLSSSTASDPVADDVDHAPGISPPLISTTPGIAASTPCVERQPQASVAAASTHSAQTASPVLTPPADPVDLTTCTLNTEMSPPSAGSRFSPLHTPEETPSRSDPRPSTSGAQDCRDTHISPADFPPFTPVKGKKGRKK